MARRRRSGRRLERFCAIRDWHPAIGTCTEDGKSRSTRTLVTKDGKATFVELQTADSQEKHLYGYTFVSSPLPVSNYKSILKVTAKGRGSFAGDLERRLHAGPGQGKGCGCGVERHL